MKLKAAPKFALVAALGVPLVCAYAPAKLVAAPVTSTVLPTTGRYQPLFTSHILSIRDVLNQCGGPSASDILHCPLVEFRSFSRVNLW